MAASANHSRPHQRISGQGLAFICKMLDFERPAL